MCARSAAQKVAYSFGAIKDDKVRQAAMEFLREVDPALLARHSVAIEKNLGAENEVRKGHRRPQPFGGGHSSYQPLASAANRQRQSLCSCPAL